MTGPGPDTSGREHSTRPQADLDASIAIRYVGFVPDSGPEPVIRPELREPLPVPLVRDELDREDEDRVLSGLEPLAVLDGELRGGSETSATVSGKKANRRRGRKLRVRPRHRHRMPD